MARPKKEKVQVAPKDDEVEVSSLNAGAFKRHIEEIVRQKDLAAEYSGNTGQATKQACDATGLHRKAIGLCASAFRMEPAKRTAFVSDLIKGLDALGYLDEGTLFSSPRKEAAEAAEARQAGTAPAPSPMSKKSPPPPPDEEEQVATNVHRLERGISKLDQPTGSDFAVN